MPRSLGVLQPLVFVFLVGTSRALARFWLADLNRARANCEGRLLIYGAGTVGVQTAAALRMSQQYALLGFVDDDATKVGRSLNGVPVLASNDVPHVVAQQAVAANQLDVELIPLLGSVANSDRLSAIFETYRPAIGYHAAACKHVPMVEDNPGEGILNNVFGTLNTARAAMVGGVRRFVLISTDKAVRPTNVMGASKRMAELVLQALAMQGSATCFTMVRFGNVLGSSGSVVPLFRRQLSEGGPLTVTHAEVTRYFMTIPEAAQLVLQAGAMAAGGDVFVLDMGEPVKIMDLARRMVELSGLRVREGDPPDGDIEIIVNGLRPGEKLYEELLIGDNTEPTAHARIMKAHEDYLMWDDLVPHLNTLRAGAEQADLAAIKTVLQTCVHGYGDATH